MRDVNTSILTACHVGSNSCLLSHSGVCGNCGEVAFQCRKCRHINYDRLDAFLCVECGYCTSGAFVFELTAGIALNAIGEFNHFSTFT